MPRTRDLKPRFFKNDQVTSCSPLARLLFAGLWCWADREGRIEDRPRILRAEILPDDDTDCDQLLNELESRKLIKRYSVGRRKYIWIIGFTDNQRVHPNEVASKIPPYKPRRKTPESLASQSRQNTTFRAIPSLPSIPSLNNPPIAPPSGGLGDASHHKRKTKADRMVEQFISDGTIAGFEWVRVIYARWARGYVAQFSINGGTASGLETVLSLIDVAVREFGKVGDLVDGSEFATLFESGLNRVSELIAATPPTRREHHGIAIRNAIATVAGEQRKMIDQRNRTRPADEPIKTNLGERFRAGVK